VFVVEQGWHVELGIPVDELDAHLAFLKAVFPGARSIMFGYGKKTFITAPPETVSEYILGPVPGPAVVQVMGISVLPSEAYTAGETVELALPPHGAEALSDYIWDDLRKDDRGKALIAARGDDPASLFYASGSQYNLLHTCNTWAADALQAAGLAVSPDGVIFSGQAMNRSTVAAIAQCPR
jgi:hypothetical protein